MSTEISHTEQTLTTPEVDKKLPIDPRIVVFGSIPSGAGELEAAMRAELAARDLHVDVVQGRLVTRIDSNFFGRYPVTEPSTPAIEATPQPTINAGKGLLSSLGNLLMGKHGREVAVSATPNPDPADVRPDSLPMGVIIFPEMRQRTPEGGTGMNVPTPYDRIVGLCEAHNVPYVLAQRNEDATQGIGQFFPQAALPSAPTPISKEQ